MFRMRSAAVVTALCFLTPAIARGDVAAHYGLGETAPGGQPAAPATMPDKAGQHALSLEGDPEPIDDVATAAGEQAGSKRAMRFDGEGDAYARRGVPTTAADNVLLEAWVRPAVAAESAGSIIHLGGGGGLGLAQNGTGVWGVLHGKATVGWAELKIGEWQHVAVVVAGGRSTLYVDGQPRGSADTSPWGYGKDDPFAIGRHSERPADFFAGDIDEVRVVTFSPGAFDPAMLLVNGDREPGSPPKGAAPANDEALQLSIDFGSGAEPAERGMTVARNRNSGPATATTGSGQDPAWRASHGSAPGVGWGRSFFFDITDERFTNGRQPAADIEVVYRSTAWAPVELWADTASGPRKVGESWGNSKDWQTLRVRLDDAFFAQRSASGVDPVQMPSDGFDLRFNGFNEDLFVRSVTIRGHHLTENPDYGRLLKLESISHPDEIFLFAGGEAGEAQTLTYNLRNIAHQAVDTAYAFHLMNWDGQTIDRKAGTLRIGGDERAALPYAFSTAGLPYGVYRLRFTLDHSEGAGEGAGGKRIRDRESYLGVSFGGELPKARDGEFLYGLDVMLGEPQRYERLLRWVDAMGVDIVRGGGIAWDSHAHVEANLPIWESRGVRVLAMCDVPWHEDDAERRRQVAERSARLEEVARTLGDRQTWWELGNEPDLTFFYKGPIEAYTEGFEAMARAINRGDGRDMVANGGLCFAGEDATRRANRFIEVVDPEAFDAFAYHAHGPGAVSERAALERMQRVTAEHGKTGKPFIETESGVAARTMAQELVQARTAVQKMAYAQSEGVPLFVWFRLLMFEEDYGNLRTDQEPRPAVLAYRNMVRVLRGFAHSHRLDLGSDLEGYAFAERDGGGRAIVLWSTSPTEREAVMRLARDRGGVAAAQTIDLFGNRGDLAVSPDGVARVAVGASPVFLRWDTRDAAFMAQAGPTLIEAPHVLAAVRGTRNPFAVTVRNPLDRTVTARLEAGLEGTTPGAATIDSPQLTLAPGETRVVRAAVELGEDGAGLDWPRVWSVFLHTEPSLDLAALTEVPEKLRVTRGSGLPQRVSFADSRVDFDRLGGQMREREAAVVMAEIDSPADQTVKVGASADWWMEWYVNGQRVYDTLASGNGGGYTIGDHTFDVPLRKGRNLVAVRVLSGSMGWKLFVGGPRELEVAQRPDAAERVVLTLAGDEGPLARGVVALDVRGPVSPLPDGFDPNSLAAWERLPVDLAVDERGLTNFFEKQPDSSRWWQGPGDLSAYGWVRADADALLVAFKATDDRHVPSESAERGDGATLRLTGVESAAPPLEVAVAAVRSEGGATLYVARLPRTSLPADLMSLELTVRDDDGATGGEIEQVLRWPHDASGGRIFVPAR